MSRTLVTLAALALVCAAAVPATAVNKTELVANMQNVVKPNKTELVARLQNMVAPNKTDLVDMGKNVLVATKGNVVTKVIVCSTGQSSVDDSTIPDTCRKTKVQVNVGSVQVPITINLLTVEAICPAGFQAVGGECAFVPSNGVLDGALDGARDGAQGQQPATGAFAQGLSTPLRDPTVRGGDPAPTGLVTTQFCTGLQNPDLEGPLAELNAIGARVFCAPVKFVKP